MPTIKKKIPLAPLLSLYKAKIKTGWGEQNKAREVKKRDGGGDPDLRSIHDRQV